MSSSEKSEGGIPHGRLADNGVAQSLALGLRVAAHRRHPSMRCIPRILRSIRRVLGSMPVFSRSSSGRNEQKNNSKTVSPATLVPARSLNLGKRPRRRISYLPYLATPCRPLPLPSK